MSMEPTSVSRYEVCRPLAYLHYPPQQATLLQSLEEACCCCRQQFYCKSTLQCLVADTQLGLSDSHGWFTPA